MQRLSRNEKLLFAGALLLIAAAYIMNYVEISVGGYILRSSTIRGALFIVLYSCWGRTLERRVMHAEIRHCLMAELLLIIFWILDRSIKFTGIFDETTTVYLWYLYYLPILFIPLIALRISFCLGRQEDYRLPIKAGLIYLIPLVLLLAVLTNNAHQLVFVFPGRVPNSIEYTYGAGYFVIVVWTAGCITATIFRMIHRNRVTKGRFWLYLPILPLLLLIVYCIIYVLRFSGLETIRLHDMSSVVCLMIVLSFELCLQVGLIPSNERYRELFLNAGLPVGIFDDKMRPYLVSRAFRDTEEAALQNAADEPLILPDGIRLVGSRIAGGYSFWQEDIRSAAKILEELEDMNESLTESSIAARKAYETRKERQQLAERNRLYDRMQREIQGKLQTVQGLVSSFEKEEDPEAEREFLLRILLLGVFIKRRSNLFFLSQDSGRIDPEELEYCLEESFVYLRMCGIICGYEVLGRTGISFRAACRIYDFFEAVMEEGFDQFESVYVHIRQQEDGWKILTEVQTRDSGFFEKVNGRSIYAEDEGDGAVLLSLHVAEGGGRR